MTTEQTNEFRPDYAVAPGEALREVMESLGMTQRDLSCRIGMTPVSLSRILRGQQPISYETASRLELATGVSARFWNNLEMQYQEQKARLDELARLKLDLEWLKEIPTKELVERGEIEPQPDKVHLLRAVLGFFGVSSVTGWHELWDKPAVAARRSACFETRPGPASAWIRIGERRAQDIHCEPHDKGRFRSVLEKSRSLTRDEPQTFAPELEALCADAGVALVLVRGIKGVPWNGATKWLAPDKAMILLNLRGKGEDKFWFSFFHEAGHVLLHGKKDLFINDGEDEGPHEAQANQFAAGSLFPGNVRSRIASAKNRAELLSIAEELGIAPGIVAGQYQFLTGRWHYYRELIRTFSWT